VPEKTERAQDQFRIPQTSQTGATQSPTFGNQRCESHHDTLSRGLNKGQILENVKPAQGHKSLKKNSEDWQVATDMRPSACIRIWLQNFRRGQSNTEKKQAVTLHWGQTDERF